MTGTPPNVIYTPTNNYEGDDHFSFTVSNGVWGPICEPATNTIYVVAAPPLTAQCRSDRIILHWNSIEIGDGHGWPESTDECLNTVVNALIAAGRQDTNQCAGADKVLQLGDFAPSWRTNAVKRLVPITDAVPSGFCDAYSHVNQSTNNAHLYALSASTRGIKINAVQMSDLYPDTDPVMRDYAKTTCGWYVDISDYADEEGTQSAIVSMLYEPGVCN